MRELLCNTKQNMPDLCLDFWVAVQLSFLAKLELKGIERKVDLITISPETNFRNIHIEALRTGVKI